MQTKMKVEWIGGPNDGLVVDYPGQNLHSIDIVLVTDPVEYLTLDEVTAEPYPPTGSRRLRVPVRNGKAIWAERETRS